MKETLEQKRQRLLGLAKASVSNVYSTGEHSIIQAIAAYNDVEKTINLLHERLEEWYGIYFPELRLGSQATYAKFVHEFGANKKAPDLNQLKEVVGDAAENIHRQVSTSIGREPSEEEFKALKELASVEIGLTKYRDELGSYLEKSVTETMPNVSAMIDYRIAAELLGKAGSLNKLALMPAGTIQLLGAEKALFKHLKFGSKPPKYGVLFKLPQIGNARWDLRGKIARVYATKLAIATRADAFTKNNISALLNESLNKAIKKIQENAKENPGKERPHFEKRQNFRGGHGNFNNKSRRRR